MCQMSLHIEFQLPLESILKYYLLVSDKAVSYILSSYDVPKLRYRPLFQI